MSSPAPSRSFTMPGTPSQHGRRPEILLDQNCRIGHCQNSTSAKTESSEGLAVEVSFEVRDPPAISLFFAGCYDLTGSQCLLWEPKILGAAGGFVLLAVSFPDGVITTTTTRPSYYTDYFIYTAGPGAPSLHLLPGPYPRSPMDMVAFMPIGDDDGGEHYAVVFLVVEFVVLSSRHHYTLHIYRSDTQAWRTRAARLAGDAETQSAAIKMAIHYPTSVVHAGSGLVAWVDLWWGVLLCNVLDENPTIRFVAVPVPEPCETPAEFYLCVEFQSQNARRHRQMTVHDGVMKFIELKFHRDGQGWMATTWTRPISSDVWHEGLTFDSSDVSVGDLTFLHLLLPEILDEEKKLNWERFSSGTPTMSLHDEDTVHILVKTMDLCHPTTFVLGVNTRSLTLESCAQCYSERIAWFEPTSVIPCYFGMTTCVLS